MPSQQTPSQQRDRALLRRLLFIQLGVTAALAMILLVMRSEWVSAGLYGSGLAIANSLVLARRVQRAARSAVRGGGQGMFWLYLASVERLLIAVAGIAIGLFLLKLEILPLLLGLLLAQLGHVGIVLPIQTESTKRPS